MSERKAKEAYPLADSAATQRAIDEARVQLLYRRAPVALITVVVNSALLVALLHAQIAFEILASWLALLAVVTIGRSVLLKSYRSNSARKSSSFWERTFAFGALLNGLAWGVGTAVFLDTPLEYQVGVLFVVGGMVAGSSSSSATSTLSFSAYTVTAAIPVIGTLLWMGSSTHLILGVTSLIFVGAMSVMAQQGHRVVVDAIALRLENDRLARELTDRTRERAGRLQQLLDHAGVITLVADPSTSTVIDASRNVYPLFGATDQALIGRSLIGSCRIEPLRSAAGWRRLVNAANEGEPTTQATVTTGPSEPRIRHLEITATMRAVAGVDYLLLVIKDVTERRELETQLSQTHLLASLGTLSAGVAHEINNPLASVLTNLRLMKTAVDLAGADIGADVDDLIKAPLDDASESAERIRTTVSNLLATTQASRARDARTEPRRIIEMLLRVVDNEIRHRAELVVDAEPTPDVRADPLRLYQVFLPLVLQATQAIAEGDATRNRIAVRIRHAVDDDMVRIDIEDTGPALTTEDAAGIFDPFLATRPERQGTGLGLSVCRRVVGDLGGTIQAGPSRAGGTRFTVRLPAAEAMSSAAERAPTPAPTITETLAILIVDDDDFVGRALARLLSQHRVVIETSAAAALDLIQTPDTFDIVLCDIMMPEMSGMEFYSRINARHAEVADKIIFMTGGAFTDAANAFLTSLGRPCLVKPFDLTSANRAILERRAAVSGRVPLRRSSSVEQGPLTYSPNPGGHSQSRSPGEPPARSAPCATPFR